jgi:HNH endonuclease
VVHQHAWTLAECFTEGPPDQCWPWRGLVDERVAKWRGKSASRLVYAQLVGPIPDGQILQRTCRNYLCVNPGHMELVTRAISMARRNRGI